MNEVGLSQDSEEAEFVGVFETLDGDPRGHIIHHVVKIRADDVDEDDDRQFFATTPENIIPYQRKLLLDFLK